MNVGKNGKVVAIDWSLISSVANADRTIHVNGTIYITVPPTSDLSENPSHRYSVTDSYFNVPDVVTTDRLTKAMRLLMNSCHKRTKFD